MIATTEEDFKNLRAGGKVLAGVLADTLAQVRNGVATAELDLFAEHAIRARGGIPSFLHYQPEGAAYPYPAALCVSINSEVVHGIPRAERVIKEGDIVSLDLGLSYNGYFLDAARTMFLGTADDQARLLIDGTKEALAAALGATRIGGHVGDIGDAIVRIARARNLGVVEELGGHAVGRAVHERPFIANDGKQGEGEVIVSGMVLAIEPMLAEGKGAVVVAEDEWTYIMKDGKRAAHFEDTVIVTEKGIEILTR
ncbi:type I methionyl aminopeptidase [Candidatus Kaiserbacteria bacterium]|nr:type I methionyl aminopeptidase [Candidatus Kaiserbacteria bacterium]